MEKKILKNRWWIIILSVVVTLACSSLLLKIQVDPDLKHYFPKTMTSMVNTDRIEEVFGNQDMVMIIFRTKDILETSTLERIKAVEKEIGRVSGIRRTSSVFGSNRIHGEQGVMYVDPTIDRIPQDEAQKEALRKVIMENEMVYRVMVSDDFTSTALILTDISIME